MIQASSVQEILYNFSMFSFREFAAKSKTVPLCEHAESRVFKMLLKSDKITATEATMLSDKDKKVLFELLTQHIMFLELAPDFTFPDGLLDGSSGMELGLPLLTYIHETAWLFPKPTQESS
ncbi:hypothetical protein [Solidesulfovibrio carbinolicus]|uniref:Uncharacterized protein n=1 Tax=Solidesulfovibrio carbinolicus TaxID=296842 RepID=A0A4P6HJU5_9BACT|nr:hypothetical protein [Solidesulfovibrio carbinolicus]QAZ66744.1 hypothetical protein C3Y92_05600 [Solidesulfovibrio carbinolicus]